MSKQFINDQVGLLSLTHAQRSQQQSGQITPQSILTNRPKFLKAIRHTEVCGVIIYSKGEDQPGKVVNPAYGQLMRKNEHFSVAIRA